MSKIHKKTGSVCVICDEPREYGIIFHKTRRQTHGICLECAIGYLRPILTQATNNIRKNIRKDVDIIKCPGAYHGASRNQCKISVSLGELFIPDCDISLDVFRISYIMNNHSAFICPEMKCGQIVDVDNEYTGNQVVCHGGCHTSWCRNCLTSPYHKGKTCIEVEAENKSSENGRLIWEMKRKGTLKFCPQCRAPCIKHNGCNKMICGSCGVKWCWICGRAGIDYDHYNAGVVGACNGRLWEGVDNQGNQIDQDNPVIGADEAVENIGIGHHQILPPVVPPAQPIHFPPGGPVIQYMG